MSCYIRHLKEQMRAAGLPDDRDGRREADRRIRVALNAVDDDCPQVWQRVKKLNPGEVLAILRALDFPLISPDNPG